ncbi:M4 family metallopeptidase [Bacillus cereus]
MGEQTGSVFRDMENPASVPILHLEYLIQMITVNLMILMDGIGGVHFNSSIINKVAYLIAKGGTHNGVTVKRNW